MFDYNSLVTKDVIIYGAGSIAQAVIGVLNELGFSKKIRGIVVSSTVHTVKEICGIPVYLASDFLPKHKDFNILLAVREIFVEEIIRLLQKLGVQHYQKINLNDFVISLEDKCRSNNPELFAIYEKNIDRVALSDEEYVMFLSKQLKSHTLNFEVNLADHCNLNCQCCNHFSPISPKKFLDFNEYERDIKRISELYKDNSGTLMLLGGEPLLNPQITEIIQITQKYLPFMQIDIVTNGLLLKKMNDDFWNTCQKCNVAIQVTKYPVNFDYASIESIAKTKNVNMKFCDDSVEQKTTYRLPFVETGNLNPFRNYAKCYHANRCVTLKNGRLYTCPMAANINILNSHFGKKFPQNEANSINIYTATSVDEIDEFLKKPNKLCSYCDVYNYEYDIPWKTSSGNINEWINV